MRVQVDVLGHFQVSVDGRAVSANNWRRSRSAAIVKLPALAPARRMPVFDRLRLGRLGGE
jgi:DNA-binding SARP family transcriptional activator